MTILFLLIFLTAVGVNLSVPRSIYLQAKENGLNCSRIATISICKTLQQLGVPCPIPNLEHPDPRDEELPAMIFIPDKIQEKG